MPIPTYNPAQSTSTPNNLTEIADTTGGIPSNTTLTGTQNNSTGQNLAGHGSESSGSGQEMNREEADRLYEERMEDEYAKREGGA